MPDEREFELCITPPAPAAPLRVRLVRHITTLGSDPAADIRLPDLPRRLAALTRDGAALRIQPFPGGEALRLEPGASLVLQGVRLSWEAAAGRPAAEAGIPLGDLAERLTEVRQPEEALRLMLDAVAVSTGAESGAVLLREPEGYALAAAFQAGGRERPELRELLSDSVVRRVLESGTAARIDDAQGDPRYAGTPSLVALRLRSILCVPMKVGGTVLGAVFLGKRDPGQPFGRRQADDLALLASLAVPLLVQLRRVFPGTTCAQSHLLGECEAMYKVRELIERVAPSELSVLIQGATGTGKELVARALHGASPRAAKPLVALNCAAVPESLLEAELFGYRRGAFTGAVTDRRGRIEQADGSTLFLDEVGDMPQPMQVALLRVLEAREVVRLGENQARAVDFRLIAATHKDLEAEAAAGRFRQDLLFRLKEFTIALPPLRERGDDVLLLAHLFLRHAEQELGLRARRFSAAAEERLLSHPWPGNVRELRAAVRRAAVLCDGAQILPEHLLLEAATPGSAAPAPAPRPADDDGLGDLGRPLERARDEFTARYVAAVLARHGGDRERAARALGISLRSLYRHLADSTDKPGKQ